MGSSEGVQNKSPPSVHFGMWTVLSWRISRSSNWRETCASLNYLVKLGSFPEWKFLPKIYFIWVSHHYGGQTSVYQTGALLLALWIELLLFEALGPLSQLLSSQDDIDTSFYFSVFELLIYVGYSYIWHKIWFSAVNLSQVNLILRPASSTLVNMCTCWENWEQHPREGMGALHSFPHTFAPGMGLFGCSWVITFHIKLVIY